MIALIVTVSLPYPFMRIFRVSITFVRSTSPITRSSCMTATWAFSQRLRGWMRCVTIRHLWKWMERLGTRLFLLGTKFRFQNIWELSLLWPGSLTFHHYEYGIPGVHYLQYPLGYWIRYGHGTYSILLPVVSSSCIHDDQQSIDAIRHDDENVREGKIGEVRGQLSIDIQSNTVIICRFWTSPTISFPQFHSIFRVPSRDWRDSIWGRTSSPILSSTRRVWPIFGRSIWAGI